MIERREFYINGTWVAPVTPRDYQVINPSTAEPCAVISLGSAADTNAAVAAAKAAFPAWAATPPQTRLAYVEAILVQYHKHEEAMAQAISLEMGAPSICLVQIKPLVCRGIWKTSLPPLKRCTG